MRHSVHAFSLAARECVHGRCASVSSSLPCIAKSSAASNGPESRSEPVGVTAKYGSLIHAPASRNLSGISFVPIASPIARSRRLKHTPRVPGTTPARFTSTTAVLRHQPNEAVERTLPGYGQCRSPQRSASLEHCMRASKDRRHPCVLGLNDVHVVDHIAKVFHQARRVLANTA